MVGLDNQDGLTAFKGYYSLPRVICQAHVDPLNRP